MLDYHRLCLAFEDLSKLGVLARANLGRDEDEGLALLEKLEPWKTAQGYVFFDGLKSLEAWKGGPLVLVYATLASASFDALGELINSVVNSWRFEDSVERPLHKLPWNGFGRRRIEISGVAHDTFPGNSEWGTDSCPECKWPGPADYNECRCSWSSCSQCGESECDCEELGLEPEDEWLE